VPSTEMAVVVVLPVMTALGTRTEIAGAGFGIGRMTADEVPPPGGGFTAANARLPADAISPALSATLTCVPLT